MGFIDKSRKGESANTQTFYNMVSTILKSGVVFITMPVFTRLLGSAQYGEYSIYVSWLSILGCFMGINVKSSLGTGIIAFDNNYKKFRSSVLLEGTIVCIGMSLVLMILYRPINEFLKYPFFLFIILIFEAIAQFITDFASFAWVYEKKAKYNMLFASFLIVITSTLSIALIWFWNWDRNYLFVGRVIGTAVPHIVIAVVVWWIMTREYTPKYNKEYWNYGIHFGLPMVIHLFSQQILVQSDRIMMKSMGVSGSDIGIYSFYYTFVGILTTILGALNNSWTPFLYEDLKDRKYSGLNQRVRYYVEVFTCLAIGFLMISREASYIFANSEYWTGIEIIPVFVLVAYTMYFYQFAVNYEIFNAKTKYVAIGTSIAAITNVILNYVLIRVYGMYGAGIATLLSYIVLAIIHTVLVINWKYERYPLSYRSVWIGFITVIIGCVVFCALRNHVLIRWIIAILDGIFLILSIYKRKTIF